MNESLQQYWQWQSWSAAIGWPTDTSERAHCNALQCDRNPHFLSVRRPDSFIHVRYEETSKQISFYLLRVTHTRHLLRHTTAICMLFRVFRHRDDTILCCDAQFE